MSIAILLPVLQDAETNLLASTKELNEARARIQELDACLRLKEEGEKKMNESMTEATSMAESQSKELKVCLSLSLSVL